MILPNKSGKILFSTLYIDNRVIADFPQIAIDLNELNKSRNKSGEFYILSCECGVPMCNGIFTGIKVKQHSDFVSWEIIDPGPRRIYNFKKSSYNNFIVSFTNDFIQIYKKIKPKLKSQEIRYIHDSEIKYWEFLK